MKRGPHFELSPDLTYEDYMLDEALRQTDLLRNIKNLLAILTIVIVLVVILIIFSAISANS